MNKRSIIIILSLVIFLLVIFLGTIWLMRDITRSNDKERQLDITKVPAMTWERAEATTFLDKKDIYLHISHNDLRKILSNLTEERDKHTEHTGIHIKIYSKDPKELPVVFSIVHPGAAGAVELQIISVKIQIIQIIWTVMHIRTWN